MYRKTSLLLLLIFWTFIAHAQIVTGSGMVYEDEVKHTGYVEGKVYKTDGTILQGHINFPYTDADIRFKLNADDKDAQKFTPEHVTGFTLVKDSFATLLNFSPEIYGVASKRFYKKGFVKVSTMSDFHDATAP